MKKFNYSRVALLVCVMLAVASCSASSSGEGLTLGEQYEIVRVIYLEGVYNSPDDQEQTPEKSTAYLTDVKYAKRSEVYFQVEVPVGTVMTVVSSAEHVIHFPYVVDQYKVRLTPDPSRGLSVLLSLDRGMEGDLDGLNPQIFRRFNEKTE